MAAQYGTSIEYGNAYEEGGFSTGTPPFQKRPRRRLNVVPIILGLILPWIMFSVIFSVLATDFHSRQPVVSVIIAGIGFLICAGVGALAIKSKIGKQNAPNEPNWFMFLFLTMSIAWILAVILGNLNFKMITAPQKGISTLNTYAGVDPTRNRGQQIMDAGTINFAPGSQLDVGKSMAFRNRDFYCVAPITLGVKTLATYDFWAVGKNCCSDGKFHCSGFNLQHPVAMRLMDDDARGYYRLAVQQAEAAHHIKSIHPLFFTLGEEPGKIIDNMKAATTRNVMTGLFGFFILQSFLVAIAAMIFSKVV